MDPGALFDQYGVISRQVVIEDDLHRALAPFGFPASRCSISMELADGRLRPLRYDALFGCFGAYDVAMHQYGGWFEEQYPDLEPIQGVHYRAWNQTDETAPARAAEHLDEWIELVIQPIVDEGGDIMSFEG